LAVFAAPGIYDINRWKMETNLKFQSNLLSASAAKVERVGSSFSQFPTSPQIIEISIQ